MSNKGNYEIKLDFMEDKKPNWFKRLFQGDRLNRNEYTLGRFVWSLYYARKEHEDLSGYIRENASCHTLTALPSKKLRQRYGMRYEQINTFAWWLLEQYFEGNLIEKPKDEPQPKQ